MPPLRQQQVVAGTAGEVVAHLVQPGRTGDAGGFAGKVAHLGSGVALEASPMAGAMGLADEEPQMSVEMVPEASQMAGKKGVDR